MPGSLLPRPRWPVILAACLAGMIPVGGIASEPESVPFRGVPHPVPGRIEAEEFDRGGDGVAFHGAGLRFAGHPQLEITRGRPDAEISVGLSLYLQGPERVWARSGEWMTYTVEVMTSAAYTILLKTDGAPIYSQYVGGCWNPLQWGRGSVAYHLEVDGFRVTPDLPADSQVATPRIWLEAGRHQLRLVVDQVQDVSGLHFESGSYADFSLFLTFPVDWMEVVRAPELVIPTAVAGTVPGFQDGTGDGARLGYRTHLIGETPAGDLVLFDDEPRAFRIASPLGEVRTLAGATGNPPQDGTGNQAGFGPRVHSLVMPSVDIVSLETRPAGGYRIARVDAQGVVTTLYSDVPLARMNPEVPGWISGVMNMAVSLARIEFNDRGEVEVLGGFIEARIFVCGPWGIVYDVPTPWLARFRLVGQELALVTTVQGFTALLKTDVLDLGEGYRTSHYQLFREEPAGFVHDVLPGVTVFSMLRAADRTLWAVIEGVLCRMAPDPEAGIISTYAKGGTVPGFPGGWIPAGREIVLNAVPATRFSQFIGWFDGSTDNPRTVTTGRDATLSARFEVRLPEPNGIDPQSPSLGPDGYFQFKVHGNSRSYVPVPAVGQPEHLVPCRAPRTSVQGDGIDRGWLDHRRRARGMGPDDPLQLREIFSGGDPGLLTALPSGCPEESPALPLEVCTWGGAPDGLNDLQSDAEGASPHFGTPCAGAAAWRRRA